MFKKVCMALTLIGLLTLVMPTNVIARGNDYNFEVDSNTFVEVTIINPVTSIELLSFVASSNVPLEVQIDEKVQALYEETMLYIANEFNIKNNYLAFVRDDMSYEFAAASFCSHVFVTTGVTNTWTTHVGTHQVMVRVVVTNPVNGAIISMTYRMETCVITLLTIERAVACQWCGMPSSFTEHSTRHTHC